MIVENFINMGYAGLCREYRENKNPVKRCGHVVPVTFFAYRLRCGMKDILDLLIDIYGEFYHIDPQSLVKYEDHILRRNVVYFKAKSRIKPWSEELEDYKTECLLYWINNL